MKKILIIILASFFAQSAMAVSDTDPMDQIDESVSFTVNADFTLPLDSNFFYFESEKFGKICSLFFFGNQKGRTVRRGHQFQVFSVITSPDQNYGGAVGTTLYNADSGWMPQLDCYYHNANGEFSRPLTVGELKEALINYFNIEITAD